jgi:transposase-like protein
MTIVTDQDHAIAKAIEIIFPSVKHLLCVTHIFINAPSHLSSTNSNQYNFSNCLFTCESEEEFESIWNKLKECVTPDTINWQNIMYKI